jgi:hypothetical protein
VKKLLRTCLVAGHALDLIGTRIAQPQFEHEGNPIYLTLRPYGLRLNWPLVIACKATLCLVAAVGLRAFLVRRRRYYPERVDSVRELVTSFIYGRPLSWLETLYKLPRSVTPSVLTVLAWCALSGPYYAYVGYDNVASLYGWPQLGGFWVGRYWIDWGGLVWMAVLVPWFCWQLWRDFRIKSSTTMGPVGDEFE